jgi:hypothetical protein
MDRLLLLFDLAEKSSLRPSPDSQKVEFSLLSFSFLLTFAPPKVARQIEERFLEVDKYAKWSSHWIEQGQTPLFEWVSPRNKILLDYQSDQVGGLDCQMFFFILSINSSFCSEFETMFRAATCLIVVCTKWQKKMELWWRNCWKEEQARTRRSC